MPNPPRPSSPALPEATISEYEGVRSLHLGSIWIQGSMRIARPDRIELEYVQRMLAALLWIDADRLAGGHAVQLGLGAASLTRFTHDVLRMPTTAVELNPAVIALCRHSFRLGADRATLRVVQRDAADWVRDAAHRNSASLLQVDLYDDEAAGPVLDDAAFYECCHAVLEEGGVMSVNLFGRQASLVRSLANIGSAFAGGTVCSLRPTREGNCIVLAGRAMQAPERATLLERAASIEARFGAHGLPARKWVRMLRAPLVAAAADDTIATVAGCR